MKPKAQAQEEYALAVNAGHSAVLMEAEAAASMYKIDVGNLEAMSEAVVEIRYLRMLDSISDSIEFVHTATWVPPYIGSAGDVATGVDKVRRGGDTGAAVLRWGAGWLGLWAGCVWDGDQFGAVCAPCCSVPRLVP